MSIYDTRIPANAEIYIGEFKKMIEFEMLDPANMIKLVWEDFDLWDYLSGVQSKIISKEQSASIVKDLRMYLLVAVFVFIFLVIAFFLSRIRSVKKKVLRAVGNFKKKFFFNGMIKSLEVSYLQTLMTTGVQLKIALTGSIWLDTTSLAIAIVIMIAMLCVPIISYTTLNKHRDHLRHWKTSQKFSNLTIDIHLLRTPQTIYYWPLFMLRRFLFVLIPTVFFAFPQF